MRSHRHPPTSSACGPGMSPQRIAPTGTRWRAGSTIIGKSLAAPGRLPGRQDLVPEDIAPLWSRAWMLDVFRDPLRYRYRLCGTEMVRSLGHEVTGEWLDEVHPALIATPQSRERFRFMAETGRAPWRRGVPLWTRDPKH